jgi:shikimate kinase
LARLLRFSFHDSDADIEAKTGVDIAFIFEKEGEAGFRQRELESIERLTRLDGVVLATGGGAVIDPDNRRLLAGRGTVVYLETSVAISSSSAPVTGAIGRCSTIPTPRSSSGS